MARPRKQPLPRGITVRERKSGDVYLISYQVNGKQRQELAGSDLSIAKRRLAQRRREVKEGRLTASSTASWTLREFVEKDYLPQREAEGNVRTLADIEAKFRDHILPILGPVQLEDLRGTDVRDWVWALRKESSLAAKTIVNVHGVLNAALHRAVFRGLIPSNPAAKLPTGTLPTPAVRDVPPFGREEVRALVYSPEVQPLHRVVCAIAAFTGMRMGEAVGLRWRDIDTTTSPLWRIDLRSQYGGRPLKGKPSKPGSPREIPVHRELERILADWKAEGWRMVFGRDPKPDDFVAPNDSKRSRLKCFTECAWRRQFEHVCADASVQRSPGQAFHSLRRFFITHVRADGAARDVVERITHNARGSMVDRYTHWEWETLCKAVGYLQLRPAPSSGAPGHDAFHDASPETPGKQGRMMEAAGVEPASASSPRHCLLRV